MVEDRGPDFSGNKPLYFSLSLSMERTWMAVLLKGMAIIDVLKKISIVEAMGLEKSISGR